MPEPKASIDPQGRRNSPRSNFEGMVDLVIGGRLYKEMSKNISETGIFLKSSHPDKYKIFDELTLSFQMPDSRPVKQTGTVVRKTDGGIGVLFTGVNYPSAYRYAPRIDDLFPPRHSA